MLWRVVVSSEQPDEAALAALAELTGLGRGEIVLSLRRGDLIAGTGMTLERARELALRLADDFRLAARAVPLSEEPSASARQLFRVVLTGYRPGSRARLRDRLEKLSGLPSEQIALWMGRIPFVLRRGIDHETARTVRRRIQSAGGLVDLKPDMGPPAGASGDGSKPYSRGRERGAGAVAEQVAAISGPPPASADVPPVVNLVAKGSRTGDPPHVIQFLPPARPDDPDFRIPPAPMVRSSAPPQAFEFLPPPEPEGALPPIRGTGPAPRIRRLRRPAPVLVGSGEPAGAEAAGQLDEPGGAGATPRTRFSALLMPAPEEQRPGITELLASKRDIGPARAGRLVQGAPSVLRTFDSLSDLLEWVGDLEEAGATVSVVGHRGERPSEPEPAGHRPPDAAERTTPDFMRWLTGSRE